VAWSSPLQGELEGVELSSTRGNHYRIKSLTFINPKLPTQQLSQKPLPRCRQIPIEGEGQAADADVAALDV